MSRALCALAAIVAAAAASTAAGAPPTTPPERAVLRGLQIGDVSCYLELEAPDGAVDFAHADFDLCEQTDLIGAPVLISYEPQNVIAASCEGDPECRDTQTVPLAVDMWRDPGR